MGLRSTPSTFRDYQLAVADSGRKGGVGKGWLRRTDVSGCSSPVCNSLASPMQEEAIRMDSSKV